MCYWPPKCIPINLYLLLVLLGERSMSCFEKVIYCWRLYSTSCILEAILSLATSSLTQSRASISPPPAGSRCTQAQLMGWPPSRFLYLRSCHVLSACRVSICAMQTEPVNPMSWLAYLCRADSRGRGEFPG
ncbi:hypothetical protein BJX62DRAFT_184008 [Aspergillus germanicus]